MKLSTFLNKTKEKKPDYTGYFAHFFLHASEKEKKKVFEDAARRANEDQRALIENVNRLRHKAT